MTWLQKENRVTEQGAGFASQKTTAPTWVATGMESLATGLEELSRTSATISPSVEIHGDHLICIAAQLGKADICFQFTGRPDSRGNPTEVMADRKVFRKLLAEVVERHFGSTANFAVDYERKLGMWALLGRNLRSTLSYTDQTHVLDFVELLDACIDKLEEA